MSWVHRFMVVPSANASVAQQLCTQLALPYHSADNMFTVGLSPTGASPATHYISSGLIDAQLAMLLGDSTNTYAAYQSAGGTSLTLTDIQNLYTACPIGTYIRSDAQGSELDAINQLNLQFVKGP